MGIISYIVRIPLLQMNDNIFLHFLYGPYLVVFKNNSLCKMGDNELNNKKPLANLWHFCRGLIRSVLRIKTCASWGIMNQIVKSPTAKECQRFLKLFCSGLIWSYLRITACARWGIMSYIV